MTQTKAPIEAIALSKASGQLYHSTGDSNLNSDDYFKIWLLLQHKQRIKELEKEKEDVFNRTNVQCQIYTLLCKKSNDVTQEISFAEIKVLVRWKLNKVPPGDKQALIDMYL